jgi:hypothetical protein
VKLALRVLVILAALILAALPAVAYLTGREGLVLSFVAVGLAGLCSFLAYRGALSVRRRIDEIGAGGEARSTSTKR